MAKIIVAERGKDSFHAFFEGGQTIGARGDTPDEALGKLVRARAADLGLEVEERSLKGDSRNVSGTSTSLSDYPV